MSESDALSGTLIVIAIALVVIAAIIGVVSWDASGGNITVTVQNKFIDNSGSSSHYIITDTHGANYEIDKAWYNYFNGSPSINPDSIYSMIKVNGTYCLHTVGWRINFAYWYPLVQGATIGTC